MASHTGPGSALEHALEMAVLAGQIAMEAPELIAGCQVVELRSLDGLGVRYQEDEQQKPECQDEGRSDD